ncbi:hypothetical protein [Microvirga zambiensis]|uniref:hypothetical protein n=1 Tax=Microvirga zambiensis TaxID=1402137 RepID=UPI00191DF2B1|nr:hypothetical protein [Microvirga zambiensis]
MGEVIRFKPRLRVIQCEPVEDIEIRDLLIRSLNCCSMCLDTGWAPWTDGEEYFRERCPCGAPDTLPAPTYPGAA